MNNQILMNNYLSLLKSDVEVYVHGTLESSNEEIRNLLKEGLDNTMKHQALTYDIMRDFGWYQVNNVKASDINKVYQKICNC